MTLSHGTNIGRYEIRSQLGAGGMGEVYQARDPKINRDVAIKVLPAAFSSDADRLRRFEQEVQATGKLNHPNILAVYDVETHNGAPYVVYELLEGETLRERLRGGAVSTRKAVDFASQIANGLSAAHGKGIVHRDLKPDNIFITNDGHVKILDFGLAKLLESSSDTDNQTDVLTRKVNTDPGAVMGTAGYMSPEQVRGRPVDHRTDIFSFGAVFYEMLSGKRAFHGDSAIETLNAILKEDPVDLSTTNPNIAPALERVVSHCLEKSPDRRFQSATDIAFALESLSDVTSHPSLVTRSDLRSESKWTRERIVWMASCAALLLGLSALAFVQFSRSTAASPLVRLTIATPENATYPARVTISPDGSRVVFVATSSSGKRVLWLRPLDSPDAKPLEGTDDAAAPFWSPDSRFIGYFANRKLLKIDASGGQPQTLCDSYEDRGGTWNRDGIILFGAQEGLYRVSAQGGAPTLATKLQAKEEAHRWPYFLPDGRHFIFLGDAETKEDHHVRIGSLDSQESEVLFSGISRLEYGAGYLLYVNQGALVAHPFDAETRKLTGEARVVARNILEVGQNHEFDFAVSETGVLAYQTGDPNSQLTWFDRQGKKLSAVGESRNYVGAVLSPDGKTIATGLADSDGRVNDVWLVDLTRDGFITRLTFESTSELDPVWSPDGKKICFGSNRSGDGHADLYIKSAGGAGDDQLLLSSPSAKYPTHWSSDGKFILYESWAPQSKGAIWVLSLADNQARPLLQSTTYDQFSGQISPDGRYLAYSSNELGKSDVFVQPFAATGEKWRISLDGAGLPLWRKDGKELYYLTFEGKLMAVDITESPKFQAGVPRQLLQANIKPSNGLCYGATPDGQRFLINTNVQNNSSTSMTIVMNWTAALKQ